MGLWGEKCDGKGFSFTDAFRVGWWGNRHCRRLVPPVAAGGLGRHLIQRRCNGLGGLGRKDSSNLSERTPLVPKLQLGNRSIQGE